MFTAITLLDTYFGSPKAFLKIDLCSSVLSADGDLMLQSVVK